MARTLVTVGTDGFTDWVQLTDGSKLSLGPVSVLSFVTKLCPDGRKAKQALEGFLRDRDQMWAMLTPRRARWAADSFIAQDQRTTRTLREGKTMTTIDTDLAAIEKHIGALDKAAAAGTPKEKMAEGFDILGRLTGKLRNKSASDLGLTPEAAPEAAAPETPEVATAAPEPASGIPTPEAPTQGLTYDIYTANNQMAEQIISQAEATTDKIDKLVEAGKKFNAARAKSDLHAVTNKVAGILSDTDLTAPWVADDLKKLAARSQQLHDLFAPAKVSERTSTEWVRRRTPEQPSRRRTRCTATWSVPTPSSNWGSFRSLGTTRVGPRSPSVASASAIRWPSWSRASPSP
jgi:hypothetical protein